MQVLSAAPWRSPGSATMAIQSAACVVKMAATTRAANPWLPASPSVSGWTMVTLYSHASHAQAKGASSTSPKSRQKLTRAAFCTMATSTSAVLPKTVMAGALAPVPGAQVRCASAPACAARATSPHPSRAMMRTPRPALFAAQSATARTPRRARRLPRARALAAMHQRQKRCNGRTARKRRAEPWSEWTLQIALMN